MNQERSWLRFALLVIKIKSILAIALVFFAVCFASLHVQTPRNQIKSDSNPENGNRGRERKRSAICVLFFRQIGLSSKDSTLQTRLRRNRGWKIVVCDFHRRACARKSRHEIVVWTTWWRARIAGSYSLAMQSCSWNAWSTEKIRAPR